MSPPTWLFPCEPAPGLDSEEAGLFQSVVSLGPPFLFGFPPFLPSRELDLSSLRSPLLVPITCFNSSNRRTSPTLWFPYQYMRTSESKTCAKIRVTVTGGGDPLRHPLLGFSLSLWLDSIMQSSPSWVLSGPVTSPQTTHCIAEVCLRPQNWL